jgi:hypothetical protein
VLAIHLSTPKGVGLFFFLAKETSAPKQGRGFYIFFSLMFLKNPKNFVVASNKISILRRKRSTKFQETNYSDKVIVEVAGET